MNAPSSSNDVTRSPSVTPAKTSNTKDDPSNSLACNGGLMRASDLDLRKTKGELFSKLVERNPQHMIVTTTPNRTSSDENINVNSSQTFKGLNKVEFKYHGSSTNCSIVTDSGQQHQVDSVGHKQQKIATMSHHQEETIKQQQQQQQQQQQTNVPALFTRVRSRWYTNEEVASILTSYNDHPEWQSNELQMRPKSGAVLLYSREKVRYRQDGYCWKKRKNGRTTREDHMKLKVQGIECIYGCYVHSALLPTFHRRCYWLLENPDIVLVHYLNQPPDDKNKMILTFNSVLLESDTKRRWTNEEIIEEIGSVFGGISQIHRTLSINFPTGNPGMSLVQNVNNCDPGQGIQGQDQQEMDACGGGSILVGNNANDQRQQLVSTSSTVMDDTEKLGETMNYNLDGDNQLGMLIINEQQNIQLRGAEMPQKNINENLDRQLRNRVDDNNEENDNGDDEMIAINQDNSNSRDNYNQLQSEISRSNNLDARCVSVKGSENTTNLINDCDEHYQQHQTDDAMTFDIVIDQQQQQQQHQDHGGENVLTKINSNSIEQRTIAGQCTGSTSSMIMYDLKSSGPNETKHDPLTEHDRDGLGRQQQTHQLAELDSNSFCDHTELTATTSATAITTNSEQHSPCSPVTQIFNKIVDDIETYAIPFELSQFEPNHHHLHDSSEIQSMDTSEPDQDGASQIHLIGQQTSYHTSRQDHSPVATNHQFVGNNHHQRHDKTECQPAQLISCDLFANCAGLGGESGSERLDDCHQVKDGNTQESVNDDMLLAQFELSGHDGETGRGDDVVVNSDELGSNVDEMRDLMIGMSSTNDTVDDTNQSNQLLLACQDPSDPLDLFSFKRLNCDSLKHHQLLDVKSTTSETDTINRLSPINVGRQPPRCNSSDDAMQLSVQRLDQYLHHASINFLANSTNSSADVNGQQLINNFSEYDHHHRDPHQNATIDGLTHHRLSTASTEPSNSTSASSLLNATSGLGGGCSGLSGASYASNRSADQGLPSSSGSNYNEGSTTSSSSIKLPLQQRQNSEQREPSNSILSSLLPKALSLDGSDLSSSATNYTSNIGGQHHHPHHHQRASPLVGPYHTGSGSHHARTAVNHHQSSRSGAYGAGQQNSLMLLVPPGTNGGGGGGGHQQALSQHHNSNRQHHYQRPSAPTISPSTGTFSLDSSLSCGTGKILVDGGQYHRSGSVTASTTISTYQQTPIQQRQQHPQSSVIEYGRLLENNIGSRASLLPILDYVPNWSSSSGGTKILLIGHWNSLTNNEIDREQQRSVCSSASPDEQLIDQASGADNQQSTPDQLQQESAFYILFDDLIVPATLIQDNVLRCYSPYHEPGFIALKVLYKNLIVSEQVLFEIRQSELTDSLTQTTAMLMCNQNAKHRSSLGFDRPETSTN